MISVTGNQSKVWILNSSAPCLLLAPRSLFLLGSPQNVRDGHCRLAWQRRLFKMPTKKREEKKKNQEWKRKHEKHTQPARPTACDILKAHGRPESESGKAFGLGSLAWRWHFVKALCITSKGLLLDQELSLSLSRSASFSVSVYASLRTSRAY